MSVESKANAAGLRFSNSGLVSLVVRERRFLTVVGLAFLVAGMTYRTPAVAMWVGFIFASYSAVANDSIQTLGTFIASNSERRWWHLWLFIGGLFLLTVGYSWVTYSGDVSYERLASKGFATAPTHFHYLQLAAPVFLVILTRLRMPVSTTFLLLSCFAASGKSIQSVVLKSVSGYAIAFGASITIWLLMGRWMHQRFRGEAHPGWRVVQWLSTGTLWCVWIMQDAANIAVYLPRALSGFEFAAFGAVVFVGLGLLFYQRGEKIQEVVNEKASVIDVRAATVVDFIYAVILYVFKIVSKVPMSTTWVFVGLLAGREIAIAIRGASDEKRTLKYALKLVKRDLLYVSLGFIISLIIAAAVNPAIGQALFEF